MNSIRCSQCKHCLVANAGEGKIYSCDRSKCVFESTTKNEAKYCDRNICLKNEYNNVGCEDCEVTKSQEPTTKNDLGVDCISRAQVQTEIELNASRYTIAKERGGMGQVEWSDQLIKVSDAVNIIRELPSVTPQPCEDAVSRKAINGYIDYILSHGMGKKKSFDFIKKFVAKLPSVTPQEPCDKCEVGNPCLYCKHEFEPQESEVEE